MGKILTKKTMKKTIRGVRQYVQDNKIVFSKANIGYQQSVKRWPEEYNSWVTSQTAHNLYRDPDRFFRVMHFKPELWLKKFIFRPTDTTVVKDIKLATIDAHRMILEQLQKFIAAPNYSGSPNVTTGNYIRHLRILLNNEKLSSVAQLDRLTGDDTVTITDTAEYATRSEANAFHHAGVGGIFYFAAKKLRKKYPQLSIRFTFVNYKSKIFGQVRAPGSSFPTLVIGTNTTVAPRIQKPRKETYNQKTGKRRWGYKFVP